MSKILEISLNVFRWVMLFISAKHKMTGNKNRSTVSAGSYIEGSFKIIPKPL